jgi:hypothetical protein
MDVLARDGSPPLFEGREGSRVENGTKLRGVLVTRFFEDLRSPVSTFLCSMYTMEGHMADRQIQKCKSPEAIQKNSPQSDTTQQILPKMRRPVAREILQSISR